MRSLVLIFLAGAWVTCFGQSDSSFIKVNFLYGSRPKCKYRSSEPKYFGGVHGGHVTIQSGDHDFGFIPSKRPVHIFNRRKLRAAFVDTVLHGGPRYPAGFKTVTFIIPVTARQLNRLDSIHQSYVAATPYDYAFFGMRCASTTREILAKIGVLKMRPRIVMLLTTFYPKVLRRRMFRKSRVMHYRIIKQEGRSTRRWEAD